MITYRNKNITNPGKALSPLLRGAFFFLLLIVAVPGSAAEFFNLRHEMEGIPFAGDMQVQEDRGGKFTLEDILSPTRRQYFLKGKKELLSHGFTDSIWWIRLPVKNTSPRELKWFLEVGYPLISDIELYRVRDGNLISRSQAGAAYPFSTRKVNSRKFIFPLAEEPRSRTEYFLRFKSKGSMNLHLYSWTSDALRDGLLNEQLLMGLYYGAVLVMLIYNFFLFFSTRDKSYLYYFFYYTGFFLFQASLNGLASQYLWPEAVWWSEHSLSFLILVSLIFAMNFCRSFLKLDENIPRMNEIFIVMILLDLVLIPFSFLMSYVVMVSVAMILTLLTAFLVTIALSITLYQGYKPARYYAVAWSFFWIGVVLYSLKTFTILSETFVTTWSMQSASMVEIILISFGLADRINYISREMEKMNENLEVLVADRTKEMNSILTELEKRDLEMQRELKLAADIQSGILPEMPFMHEGIRVDAYYSAMGQVGGDFYDIFQMQGGHLGILIADASGHGMPAAFLTAMAKISFSETIQTQLFPRDIFSHVNNELLETIQTDDFVTAFLMVIGPSYEVLYCNASHVFPMVLRYDTGEVEEWDTNGLFMGAMEVANEMYEDGQDMLNYGDRVLLFTDGITEAKNRYEEDYGGQRLKKLFADTMDLSISEAKERIMNDWRRFTAGIEQNDDVTLVIVEIDRQYRELVEYRERGFRHLSENRFDEAIDQLEKALEINSRDEKSHLYAGECYLYKKDYVRAEKHLREYLSKNEIDANVWCHLAEAYYYLRDYPQAYDTAQKALGFRKNFVRAMVVCGMSLRQLHRNNEAYQMFNRILTFDEKNRIAHREIKRLKDKIDPEVLHDESPDA